MLESEFCFAVTPEASTWFDEVRLERTGEFDSVGQVGVEIVVLAWGHMAEDLLTFWEDHAKNEFFLNIFIFERALENKVDESEEFWWGVTHGWQSVDAFLDQGEHVLLLGGSALAEKGVE